MVKKKCFIDGMNYTDNLIVLLLYSAAAAERKRLQHKKGLSQKKEFRRNRTSWDWCKLSCTNCLYVCFVVLPFLRWRWTTSQQGNYCCFLLLPYLLLFAGLLILTEFVQIPPCLWQVLFAQLVPGYRLGWSLSVVSTWIDKNTRASLAGLLKASWRRRKLL